MTTRNLRLRSFIIVGCALAMLHIAGGCAYYNTFYNIKRDFKVAEKQSARAQVTQQPGQPTQPARPGQPSPGNVPIQQYQTILQSCAKLLEYYPKSRWIDDALMIMGVSYYRTEEYARAERKFTELLTIFPNSKHVEMSIVWRARALLAQDKYDEAEAVLTGAESKLTSPEAKAAAGRTLAGIYDKRKQPEEAVRYLEQIQSISYDRDDKATDYLTLGRSYLLLGRKDDARQALLKCLGATSSADEAFESRQLLAEMSAEDGNYLEARNYLRPLQTDRRFIDRGGDVLVELARVEAVAGDPQLCVQMLEEYCAKAPQGESKAKAYYLQGVVARDKLVQLEFAKAKFDSVSAAGASRTLQDSARFSSKQLENGLSALQRMPELETNIKKLQDELVQLKAGTNSSMDTDSIEDVLPPEVEQAEEIAIPDSVLEQAPPPEMIADTMLKAEIPADSTVHEEVSETPKELSPAEMIADSIMRSLAQQDSVKRAERAHAAISDSATAHATDSTSRKTVTPPKQSDEEVLKIRLASITVQLVNAHIEAASFYSTVLHQIDSSFVHIERAVTVPDSSEDHWRATVQYGLELLKEGRNKERGKSELERVAYSESAPRAIRNAAREAIGMPKLEIEKTDQELELERVEQFLLQDAPYDELVSGYRNVLNIDSISEAGAKAIQAIAYLQEYKLGDFEAARTAHEAITHLFPDSSFSELSLAKLQPPDTNSIFLMSEEALQATMQPALEFLSASSDSSGWPPEESTLRGRRFH